MNNTVQSPLLIIVGPTASGKTKLSAQLAFQLGGEILSADSRQVYRGMDIGTGKDLEEYLIEGKQIPYHLIDICDPGEHYNVNRFHQDFDAAYQTIVAHKNVPIVCGGTGFYIYALLKGQAFAAVPVNENLRAELEEKSHESLIETFLTMDTVYRHLADLSTRKRTIRAVEIAEFLKENPEQGDVFANVTAKYNALIFGLNPPVEVRRDRISQRLKKRLEGGLVEEVKGLLDKGLIPGQLLYYGLEYKLVTQYLIGELSYQAMHEKLESEIHRFAKRQMTFFRKMEIDGLAIDWLPDDWDENQKLTHILATYRESIRKSGGIE